MTWGVHVTLAPTWFDPAETPGIGTPFMILYALHDALVKPMPGNAMAPGLAESWSVSKDGLVYEFVLRPGVKFHNGDPVTADDVKFSFERYRGVASRLLKERVPMVEVVDARHVRFRLKEPWPDFMTYYGSLATGAGWVVPKKYLEKVGDDGFKKAPVGAGPYKFVAFNPGIELVLEANEQYWRKTPSVKRLVLKAVPDEATRLAMLKRGEADVVYLLQAELAEDARRTAGLTLRPTPIVSTHWLVFLDQWDPKSPWADRRVRLAANHAIDRQAMNDAITLGFSRITWSIIPQSFDFFWQPPAYAYDPALAKRLLAEAGYPNGFDAGDFWCEPATATMSEATANFLGAVGIRTRLRPLERAAFFKSYQEKKLKNLAYSISGAFGNAPIRLENFVVGGGPFVYGSYPDIDGLFREQAAELDRKRREAALHRIQQLVHDKVMYAPIWELGFIHAQGPRVAESGLGLITGWAFSAPYEDVKLKPR
jgi:peptide/nickel transport system substrate-binding protein